MKAPAGGYTLLEVMLFLAISSSLFAATVAVIRGQSTQAEFSTSVNDVNSKLQQWLDDVSNGFTGTSAGSSDAAANFRCQVKGVGPGRSPELKTGGVTSARGTNSDCIFLGKAILVNEDTNNTQIVAVPIVGLRADADGEIINNIQDTEPIAAINSAGNLSDVDLSDRYTIPHGTKVLSVHDEGCPPATTCSHMAGFFTSLSSSSSNNGAQNALAVQYPYLHTDGKIDDASVYQCIMLERENECKTPPTKNLWPMNRWDICLATVRGNNRALLSIISTNGLGAKTTLVTGKSDVCS
jgi:hypothetical protein